MADGPLAEPKREAASGDEWSRRAHPRASRGKGRSLGLRPGAPSGDRRSERLRCRAERVEDRLVAEGTAPAARKSRGRDYEHLRDERWLDQLRVAGSEPGLDERGSEQRPGCTAYRRDEAMADRAEEVAGQRLGRKLSEELLDRPETGREIVAVVAVAKDGVESGQAGRVAIDSPSSPVEGGPKIRGSDPLERGDCRGGRNGRRR
jgi:hypothetical protein